MSTEPPQSQAKRGEWRRKRRLSRLKRLALFLLLIAFVLVGSTKVAWPAYEKWRVKRLVAHAQRSLTRSDHSSSLLFLQRAIQLDPANIQASRLIANILESTRSPAAIDWRKRLVLLEPGVARNRIDLAYTALTFSRFSEAEEALKAVPATNQNSAAYHQVAAAIAMATNNLPIAEQHFAEAVKYDPANELYRLNLAVVRMQSSNPDLVLSSRTALEQMLKEPSLKSKALRTLISDALRSNDLSRALFLSKELQSAPASTLDDRLAHLNMLLEKQHPQFGSALASVQKQAAQTPEGVLGLTIWMIAHDRAEAALAWIQGLDLKVRQEQAVIMAETDCLFATKKWESLLELLEKRDWKELEYLRWALISCAYRQLHKTELSQDTWRRALQTAEARPERSASLARLVQPWGWTEERVQALEQLLRAGRLEPVDLAFLTEYYYAKGKTRDLLTALKQMLNRETTNTIARNNLASVSMLLASGLQDAYKMAHDNYRQDPSHPDFISTHAFALHLQGKTDDGLKLLEELPVRELTKPAIAAYYGILLASAGAREKAGVFLALGEQAVLLPEERALIARARKSL